MLSLLLFLGAGVEITNAHPNQLAFFNFLAGGPALGYKWLADSDQDWGQSLPELARYVTKEGNPGLILCYSGSADPEAYGLKYQDLLSPALVSRDRKNRLLPLEEKKIYLAISSKVLQIEPEAMRWLVGTLPPKSLVDSCFFVYDLSKAPDVFLRMAHLYQQTGRNIETRWCEEKANGLGTDIIPESPMGQKQ